MWRSSWSEIELPGEEPTECIRMRCEKKRRRQKVLASRVREIASELTSELAREIAIEIAREIERETERDTEKAYFER